MINTPEILRNPNNEDFKLQEAEKYSFKEAKDLIEIGKHIYSLYAIWNAVVINIQRRIEDFGIKNLFNVIDDKTNFNEKGTNLKDRWLNVNEYKTIDYAKNLNIIDHVTHDIITALYWMKSIKNEDEENEKKDSLEIYAIVYLLEKNLFLKDFKVDQRVNKVNTQNNFKRREEDRYNDLNLIPQTHQEMLLRSGIDAFNKKDKDDSSSLIDKYA